MQNLMIYMKAHKNTIIDLSIILLLGLLSVTWFKHDLLIIRSDFDFPSVFTLEKCNPYFYIWWSEFYPGVPSTRTLTQIPYVSFIAFFHFLDFSQLLIEKILFYLWFTTAGLSMYYLVSTAVKNYEQRRMIGLVGALFYMLNPYAMIFTWHEFFLSAIFLYASLPLILALFIKVLESKNPVKNILLTNLVLLISVPAFTNPAHGSIIWITIFTYLFFYVFMNWGRSCKVTRAFQYTAALIIIWFILNVWWIIPLVHGLPQEISASSQERIGYSSLDILKIGSSDSMLDVIRLSGFWAFRSDYKGDPYFPYSPIYSSLIFMTISFLIPILAFTAFVSRPKNKLLPYFGLLALFGLFLIRRLDPPFGFVHTWLFTNFPIFSIYRNIYEKFGVIVTLSYSFLIGCSINGIYCYIKKHLRKIVALFSVLFFIFLLCGVYAWPFWSGDVIFSGGKILPSAHVKIPESYGEANRWLSKQKEDFRIFPNPLSKFYGAAYAWNYGYEGIDPSFWLFSKPTITRNSGENYFPVQVTETFAENPSRHLGKILALLNVRYLLTHRDTEWDFLDLSNPQWIYISNDILNNQNRIFLEKSFGKLDFYRNDYWKPMHIYATPNTILVHEGLDEMIGVVGSDNFTPDESVLFLSDQLTHEQYSFIAKLDNYDLKPNITFEKTNPTKYIVHINASNPFFLVFSESYHKDWGAYTNGEQVPGEHHFMANGYANAWFVNKTGSYDIVLEFWPQKLFYTGSAISITTLILCILYINKKKIRTTYKRYIKKNKNQTSQTYAVRQQPKRPPRRTTSGNDNPS